MNEFFNRSVGPVYYPRRADAGRPARDGGRGRPETGEIRCVADGSDVEAGYVLTDGTVALDGDAVAAERRSGSRCTGSAARSSRRRA